MAYLKTAGSAVDFQQLLIEFFFDLAQLGFGFDPLLAAFLLNLSDFVQRRDQRFVGMLQRFDIDDAALGFLRGCLLYTSRCV